MGRTPCCDKVGLKKGPWTPEEDQKLLAFVEEHGHGSWRALPLKAGLQRCGKSCRLRWTNYLRPDIKRGQFSLQEEKTIIHLHALLGNRWSAIATHLPKRTDNEIKNYWNTHLKKRLSKMGIDPVTHKPKTDTLLSGDQGQSKDTANLSHMAQWESARLEAEARLVRESKLRSRAFKNQAIIGQDLESPTSTLTLSENTNSPTAMFEFVGTSGSSETEILFKDEMSISRFDSGLEDMTLSTNEASHEAWRTSNVNYMDEGFTNLLLNNSDNGQSLSDSDNGCSTSEYEENKNYWNSILNLVNSTPSDSPMFQLNFQGVEKKA